MYAADTEIERFRTEEMPDHYRGAVPFTRGFQDAAVEEHTAALSDRQIDANGWGKAKQRRFRSDPDLANFKLLEAVELFGEDVFIGYSANAKVAYMAVFIEKMNAVLEGVKDCLDGCLKRAIGISGIMLACQVNSLLPCSGHASVTQPSLPMNDYIVLCAAALLAGMIDAVVGGGGLIQIPALFATLPSIAPATLLGTSKLAGVWGTGVAAVSFARRAKVEWNTAAPAAVAAFALAFLGAYTVTRIPPDFLRKLLPFILGAVALYTFRRKDFGTVHEPMHGGLKEKAIAVVVGGSIGFYDGFFGPGTGSFLVFLFVHFFGFDFLGASAVAKVVNVACNLAALLWFGYSGHLLWQVGLMMAVCNVGGSVIGSRLAIQHGSAFVRKIFLLVVSALILKTSYDAFLR